MIGTNSFFCQYLLRTITGHAERTSPCHASLEFTLCLRIFVSLQFTFFQSVIFLSAKHGTPTPLHMVWIPGVTALAFQPRRRVEWRRAEVSIWGRAGDAAALGRRALPSALFCCHLQGQPEPAHPWHQRCRAAWAPGTWQVFWQPHHGQLICHDKRNAPGQTRKGFCF